MGLGDGFLGLSGEWQIVEGVEEVKGVEGLKPIEPDASNLNAIASTLFKLIHDLF